MSSIGHCSDLLVKLLIIHLRLEMFFNVTQNGDLDSPEYELLWPKSYETHRATMSRDISR